MEWHEWMSAHKPMGTWRLEGFRSAYGMKEGDYYLMIADARGIEIPGPRDKAVIVRVTDDKYRVYRESVVPVEEIDTTMDFFRAAIRNEQNG